MALNRGKPFEHRFKQDWVKSFPSGTIDRLYDSVNGNKGISNISDFIAYNYPNIYYIECKSHKGNTFPWTALRQYDKLVGKVAIPGVRTGVVLWMIDHDVVVYLPISSVTQMKKDGCKSFNIKMLQSDKYKVIAIPSKKLQVYMDSDYSVLTQLVDGD